MEFTLDTFTSLFAPLGLMSSLVLIVALGWIVARTQSTHVVLFRVWRLASGGVEVKDPAIQNFLDQQNSLMSFRFVSGLKSKRLGDARDMIAFGKDFGDETLEDFRKAGRYFDPGTKQVNVSAIPSWPWQWKNFLLMIAGFLVVYASINALLFEAPAFVRMRSTGTHFLLSLDSARSLTPFSEDIRPSDCVAGKPIPLDRGFTMAEVRSLCGILENERLETFLKPTLEDQRHLFWVMIIAGALVTRISFGAQHEIVCAKRLAKRLEQYYLRLAPVPAVEHEQPQFNALSMRD